MIRSEGEPDTKDTAADEAYFGTGITYDLYKQAFARQSIDNHNMTLVSSVHYGVKYANAFWNGKQMVYGDGDGEFFNLFTKPEDVTGHELTHGVTQYTANLDYLGQSGALNESFSDVFGSLTKQRNLKQTADQADWIIGQGLFTNKVKGAGIRSMKAPGTAYDDPIIGKDTQPAHMKDFVKTAQDNGGVHTNSGIPNHAFYLCSMEIGGYAWEKAGKIWYSALTQKLKNNSDFQETALITSDTAGELFGIDSLEQKAVKNAWDRVGIKI